LTVTASQVFDFLDRHPICSIEKYELYSAGFRTLRRSIRAIIARLCEEGEGDSQEVADALRTSLSEWLTVPICFDEALLESVSALGAAEAVETKWGREVRTAYDLAYKAASEIQLNENPARAKIREIIRQLRNDRREWHIYCHTRARVHFESLFPEDPLTADAFLHSPRDYREVEPFDVLIKMGPLRSRGWGSAPDAVISAPRFATLKQIVWAGCLDEDDFGYDPVAARAGDGVVRSSTAAQPQGEIRFAISWSRSVIQVGDRSDDSPEKSDLDELTFFSQLARGSEMRRATLVQIDAENGILYPPHSQVATFDPSTTTDDPIGYRLPGETLTGGMFVIWPILGAADLGGAHSGEGHYSRIWKERLRDKSKYTPNDLLRWDEKAGLRRDAVRSQVIDALEAQEIKEIGNEED